MSTRGINFLDKWMAEQLPETATDDPIVISDLADKVLRAANKAGIATREISEEVLVRGDSRSLGPSRRRHALTLKCDMIRHGQESEA